MLDEILGNATDLPISEHATDTHGVTLVNFGLFDLLGLQLSPRIRDLGRITLYQPGPRADIESRFPCAGPLFTRKVNLELIAENINFSGAIEVDIDAELAALGPTGYRPLRMRDTLF